MKEQNQTTYTCIGLTNSSVSTKQYTIESQNYYFTNHHYQDTTIEKNVNYTYTQM